MAQTKKCYDFLRNGHFPKLFQIDSERVAKTLVFKRFFVGHHAPSSTHIWQISTVHLFFYPLSLKKFLLLEIKFNPTPHLNPFATFLAKTTLLTRLKPLKFAILCNFLQNRAFFRRKSCKIRVCNVTKRKKSFI